MITLYNQISITKHDVILGFSIQLGLFQVSWEDLNIATTTVDLLLMLDRKLNYHGLPLITERLEMGGGSIETCVLACLQPWKKKVKEKCLVGSVESGTGLFSQRIRNPQDRECISCFNSSLLIYNFQNSIFQYLYEEHILIGGLSDNKYIQINLS